MTENVSHSWKQDLVALMDLINDISGGIGVFALPFLVTVPGLVALLGLCLPLLLLLVAAGLLLAILSAPLVGIWWLLHLVGHMRGRET